jgi:hypothetical protein
VTVQRTQKVKVEVFDPLGHRAALLHDGVVEGGQPRLLEFDARSLASGLYFVRASCDGAVTTRTVTILK